MTPETSENDFTTIRIWREDKTIIEGMKQHKNQGLHEVIHALIMTAQINDKVIIPISSTDFLTVSKADPNYENIVKEFKETAQKIVEGRD